MANVTSGYTFTGPTDPITFAKLNLLGTPTVTIGSGEVTVAKLANMPGTGYLLGSSPSSAAAAAFRINDTGLTLHIGTGLSFGSNAVDSGIAVGQSATALLGIRWFYNATEGSSSASIETTRGLDIKAGSASGALTLGGAANQQIRLDSNGNTALGISNLATNSTNGFVYIVNCAGTPTGVPAASYTGRTPMLYDTSANKIWAYNGSWRGVVVS